jgi:transposase
MKSTQNEKILQMKSETLIIGIDVGKENHYARSIDTRGIEQAKLLRFSNSAQGFESLDNWMSEIMRQKGKTEAIVGIEPTGHYWFNLGDHLQKKGHKLAIVNPFHVKCTKELDDNSPTKNDRKDPKTIAMLVKDGRYRDVYIPEDLYQELREAVSEHERLQNQINAVSNQVIRWLDIRFPEFSTVYKAWDGMAALLILKNCPTPAKIAKLGVEGIMKVWRKELKRPSLKRANAIVRAAIGSIGRTAGSVAAEASIHNLIVQYEMLQGQIKDQETLMQELLLHVPNASNLLEIKGIGMITAAVIVSEIGNINRFQDPRQIIKMAGLNLRENSSGKHRGKTTISKRGRRRLREGLFRVMIPMLANNEEFRKIHNRNLTREHNPLNKIQSIIALCGKLVRIIYAILTKGVEYSGEKVISDIKQSMKVA